MRMDVFKSCALTLIAGGGGGEPFARRGQHGARHPPARLRAQTHHPPIEFRSSQSTNIFSPPDSAPTVARLATTTTISSARSPLPAHAQFVALGSLLTPGRKSTPLTCQNVPRSQVLSSVCTLDTSWVPSALLGLASSRAAAGCAFILPRAPVPRFVVFFGMGGRQWTRLSAQLYLDERDFELLGERVLQLLGGASVRRRL